jgi:hypothetical protein
MKVIWRNEALCLKPETDIERQSLAAIAMAEQTKPDELLTFTGEELPSQFQGIEH